MQLWVAIALSSYFFTALSNTIDKLVVTKFIPKPIIYAFYVGALGGLSVALIPFGVEYPGLTVLVAALAAGITFISALLALYTGLLKGETTRVVPILHAIIPIATFMLAYLFLDERLSRMHIMAFTILIIGLIVISYQRTTKKAVNYAFLWYAIASGVLFATTYTLAKFVYLNQVFISGFFWMRMGALLMILFLFTIPKNRKAIFKDFKAAKPEKGGLVIGNQIIGAIGFVLLDYAISIASVTLVNSLQGVLYVFVFLIVITIGNWIPELKEKITAGIVFQKLIAMAIIGYGIFLLGVY